MSDTETKSGGSLRCVQCVGLLVAMGFCGWWAADNMYQARIQGIETSTLGSLRTIVSAQEQYKEKHGAYAADIASLTSDDLVPDYWAEHWHGYRYTVGPRKEGWFATAEPVSKEAQPVADYGKFKLTTYFYVDETGVIRFESEKPATESSPARPTY